MGKSRHLASGFGAVGQVPQEFTSSIFSAPVQSFLSLDIIEPMSQHSGKNKKRLWDKKEGGGRVHKKKEASLKVFAIAWCKYSHAPIYRLIVTALIFRGGDAQLDSFGPI